jgi:hypothetical protein
MVVLLRTHVRTTMVQYEHVLKKYTGDAIWNQCERVNIARLLLPTSNFLFRSSSPTDAWRVRVQDDGFLRWCEVAGVVGPAAG